MKLIEVYIKYKDIVNYFDSYIVGLTATPVGFINRNIFTLFNNLPMIISCEKCVEELLDINQAIGSRVIVSKERCVEIRGKRLNYSVFR